jgi:hypothetical protein
MACNKNGKAAARSAAKNGIPAGPLSLHELMLQETQGIRRLMKLKSAKERLPREELARLLEMSPSPPGPEPLDELPERFDRPAHLALGQKGLAIVRELEDGRCEIQDLFMTLPPVKPNGAAPDQKNLQRLDALRTSGESIPGDEVVRLLGLKLGQPLVTSTLAAKRFGDRAKLAFGDAALGVVVATESGEYLVKEVYVPPPKEMGAPPEKLALSQADRARIELNTRRVHEAIQGKKKLAVFYSGPQGGRYYVLSPLDITTGKTKATENHHYLWLYSEKAGTVLSMRMDRVLWAKARDEAFDPAEIMQKILKDKTPAWNLSREW